jgi:hypothetical protein
LERELPNSANPFRDFFLQFCSWSFWLFSVLRIALIMPVCGAAVNHESLSLFCNIVVGTSGCATGVTPWIT